MTSGSNRNRRIEDFSRHSASAPRDIHVQKDPFEQLNFKVPRGTKLRIKRLALEQGGISMMVVFMRMLDEYERGRRTER